MPIDFSIELTATKINDQRTGEYFNEVQGCYRAGYFRSCMVMLWTVVVCDLLYKLDQLANANGDAIAKNILTEIENDRASNPDSPRWEEKLLNLVHDRTELLDRATFLGLSTLQKQRHLSAHPVLAENDRLHTPSREVCRSHIRTALEGLLIRPAIMTRKVFDAMLEDLEANSAVLIDEESVRIYLASKYMKHLTDDAKRDIFRRLWKLVFRLSDERCQKNRKVNFFALVSMLADNRGLLTQSIESDPSYFSDVQFEDGTAKPFHAFLRQFPELFKILTDAGQVGARNYAIADPSRKIVAWYLADSVSKHAEQIFAELGDNVIMHQRPLQILGEKLCEVGDSVAFVKFAIRIYGASPSYDSADIRFDSFVRPFLSHFSKDDLLTLISQANGNVQVYSRRGAYSDHASLRKYLDSAGCAVEEFEKFENLASALLRPDEMEIVDDPF